MHGHLQRGHAHPVKFEHVDYVMSYSIIIMTWRQVFLILGHRTMLIVLYSYLNKHSQV